MEREKSADGRSEMSAQGEGEAVNRRHQPPRPTVISLLPGLDLFVGDQ